MVRLCECGCGKPAPIAPWTNRKQGYVKGQARRFIVGHRAKKHGMHNSPEYNAFCSAKQRCTNPQMRNFKDYGGRGIRFLFDSFDDFIAEVGLRPSSSHSIDRYPNNDGHYEKGNVRWATRSEQQSNKRSRTAEHNKRIGVGLQRYHTIEAAVTY